MRIRFNIIFILLFFISLDIYSQTYLLDVNIGNGIKKLKGLELEIYHRSENNIIIEADAELTTYLQKMHIPFNILDKNPSVNRYFISDKRNKQDIKSKIIAEIDGNIIIEEKKPDLNNSYKFFELQKRSVKFITEKIIAPRIHFNDSTHIASILQLIETDSVRKYIQGLQDLKTRYLFSPNRDSVAMWIKNQFIIMGYTDVKIDSFLVYETWQKNVIATLPANNNYNEEIVVGAHHDSYSANGDRYLFAPGADDNASGTSAVLEMARVLKKIDYKPSATLKFVTFAAEELGLHGSYDYALKAKYANTNIKLMINHDMISYSPNPVSNSFVNVNYYSRFKHYSSLAENTVQKFTHLKYGSSPQGNSSGSDSYSFANQDYPAIYFEEGVFSPFYHSTEDIISNYNIPYCTEVIKASCATLLNVDQIPPDVKNVKIFDEGTGTSLLVKWDITVENYKIYIGTESGKYDTFFQNTGNSFSVKNLTPGVRYYIGVSSYNNSGIEGFITETNYIPAEIPFAPEFLADKPNKTKIDLVWRKNTELDVIGYNVYRSTGLNNTTEKLNNSVVSDTFYSDSNIEPGQYYYYSIKALDLSGKESEPANIRSRTINFDQGVLIVDETSDGDGSQKPSDLQVDEFFSEILRDYKYQNFDILAEKEIKLADLGAFSTVIWCGNDFDDISKLYEINTDLKNYLDMGGNFIYNGYFPNGALTGNSSFSVQYEQGSFLYDYFKISSAERKFGTRFSGAISDQYNSIFVDSSKTINSADDHLTNIEVLEAASGGINIFSYDSKYDTSNLKGKLKGRSVGVENLTGKAKTIVLSFPLYYMNKGQAMNFISSALGRFNETSAKENEDIVPISEYKLLQNYPNPFNPTTTITFELPQAGNVSIKLYDVLGKEVFTILDEFSSAGRYAVTLNASNLSSGVYYYQLKAGTRCLSKKLLLLK